MIDSDNFHRDAIWKGNDLIFRRRVVGSIVPDSKWPQMWRVGLPNGHVTDMVNLSRARDAARSLALKTFLRGLQKPRPCVLFARPLNDIEASRESWARWSQRGACKAS